MKFELKDVLTIGAFLVGVVGTFVTMQNRVDGLQDQVEVLKGEPMKLAFVERDVRRLRCDVNNVKRLLKNQPENDCD